MKIGIMQPYIFPYIGYFQLMNVVDEFVIYDNIEFTKKGWINRNRILINDKDAYITFPLKKDSDYLTIKERSMAETWPEERKKMLNRITESYRKAPNFEVVFSLTKQIILYDENNLFDFILNSLLLIKEFLDIKTELYTSSSLPIEHGLRAEKKVIEICKSRNAQTYINPIGGIGLYDKEYFKNDGVDLYFLKSTEITYPQFNNTFVPWLSIIDVMMFNTKEKIKEYLNANYILV